MQTIVTLHAIEQYRRRSFSNISDNDILTLLSAVARKGKKESRRPPYDQQIFKVSLQGHAIVAKYSRDRIIVITYLGNKKYQSWYQRAELRPRALAY